MSLVDHMLSSDAPVMRLSVPLLPAIAQQLWCVYWSATNLPN